MEMRRITQKEVSTEQCRRYNTMNDKTHNGLNIIDGFDKQKKNSLQVRTTKQDE
jgi:hypothetical protein